MLMSLLVCFTVFSFKRSQIRGKEGKLFSWAAALAIGTLLRRIIKGGSQAAHRLCRLSAGACCWSPVPTMTQSSVPARVTVAPTALLCCSVCTQNPTLWQLRTTEGWTGVVQQVSVLVTKLLDWSGLPNP